MQHEQFKRCPQPIRAIITGAVVPGRDARQKTRQYCEFACQDIGNHAALGFDQYLMKAAMLCRKLAPGLIQRRKTAFVNQQTQSADAKWR